MAFYDKILIAILDDDATFCEILSDILQRIAYRKGVDVEIHTYTDTKKLDKIPIIYDLLFLDVELEDQNGIEWAKKWKGIRKFQEMVVTSSHDSYVFDSLDLRPLAFVRKSYLDEDVEKAIACFEREQKSSPPQIIVLDGQKKLLFEPDEIEFFRANGHYVDVVLHNGEQKIIRNHLNDLQKELERYGFVRIQISYLVNMKYVDQIGKKAIRMKSGATKPLSPKYKDKLFERLRLYMITDEENDDGNNG